MNSSQIKSQKFLLRKHLRELLGSLSSASVRQKSQRIVEKILKNPDFKKAQKVFIYMAFAKEVQTKMLVPAAIKLGKRVYAPRINPQTKQLAAYEVRHPAKDLRPGFFGIPEPKALKSRKVKPADLDLVIVPGLGFDRKGRRLGRGQGYFDRFLKKTGSVKKIGLAFKEQLLKKIPTEVHDILVDEVLTD